MRSSKQAAAATATATENNRGISGHMFTLHQRLYHALSLGTRYSEGKEWKWKCTDIEIQRHVVRSISSFIESVSPDTLHHPLVKDSMADIVWALVWILQHKSEAVLSIAANVVVKLIRVIPNSILQPYSLYLVHPLASLLSSRLLEISIACATALNMILSNLSAIREKSVWEILSETKTVFLIVSGIQKFSGGTMSTEYFQEMASLLSTILQKWSASRFSVWNDTKLMEVLEAMHENPDVSVKVALLKLYSGIALCGNGAMKLLQNGEALLQMMVLCMGRSRSYSVQMEGFRLAQRLATNKQGCLKMLSLCCEPIVKAIIDGMTGWTLSSGKIANDQMSLLVEACRLALIIRWDGEHHDYFWKKGIDKVLLDLLLEKFQNGQSVHLLTFEEQISEAQEVLKVDVLLVLRPYMWDILGWLAIYCREDFNPSIHSHELLIDMLIRCAWDITLKPKETESICWKCRACSLSLPHMHAHKVVLSSSCDYLQALFQSGMQESRSQTIEVPVSWEAMIKLVNWFYTDELPQPPSGCIWDNMDDEEKLHQLQQYLELCWLAEFWFLEDVQDISYKVIVSCLDSARQLSIKIIKIASELSLWKLAEVAANHLAPFYRQLCHSGDLEALSEDLVDMIRDASVRLSQEG